VIVWMSLQPMKPPVNVWCEDGRRKNEVWVEWLNLNPLLSSTNSLSLLVSFSLYIKIIITWSGKNVELREIEREKRKGGDPIWEWSHNFLFFFLKFKKYKFSCWRTHENSTSLKLAISLFFSQNVNGELISTKVDKIERQNYSF
jgi:hypothetical protein